MAISTDPSDDALVRQLDRVTDVERMAIADSAMAQSMASVLFESEARRIEKKLGSQHPRTLKLRSRQEIYRESSNRLLVVQELRKVRQPDVGKGSLLIHGRVVDSLGLGIDELTVCATDKSGSALNDVPDRTTNAVGYFAFIVDAELVDKLHTKYGAGVFLMVFSSAGTPIKRLGKLLDFDASSANLAEIRLDRSELSGTG